MHNDTHDKPDEAEGAWFASAGGAVVQTAAALRWLTLHGQLHTPGSGTACVLPGAADGWAGRVGIGLASVCRGVNIFYIWGGRSASGYIVGLVSLARPVT